MIQLTTAAAIAKATERAKQSKVFVQPTSTFRQYHVTNRETGARYMVDFFVRKDGKRFGHCICKGGMAGLACKHLSAAAALHTYLAAQKRAA
jgi:hypothetical protein